MNRGGKNANSGNPGTAPRSRPICARGSEHLGRLLGDLFLPVFTPPWNRCSRATLEILAELGFLAVSRFTNARPPADGIVSELAVNVDLHTRREVDFRQGWDGLFEEMAAAACSGRIGFMLHHQRMNDAAFDFLDILLTELRSRSVACRTFRELLTDAPGNRPPFC